MTTFNQSAWLIRNNSQLLFGLYCIISVYCLVPIWANSMSNSSSSVTHSKVTRQGRLNYGYLDQGPETPSTPSGQSVTEGPQNGATHLTNLMLPKTSISIRSIIKRSTQESSFPNEIDYSNNGGSKHSMNSCKDDAIFCNRQVFNKEGFQQIRDFKFNNEMQWDKQDYSDYNDKETYIPGLNDLHVELSHINRIGSSNSHTSQDMNPISDMYAQTPVSYNKVFLPFNKPNILDLIRQPLSENHNMKQDPLTISQDNSVDELEPIHEEKKNIILSRGWGARGMPFNVLYMKPASRSAVVRAEQMVTPAPLTGFPTNSQHQQVNVQNALSHAPKAGNRRGGRKIRRQYSVIPQLFVSYGWGPHGK
jgi:hypothetical protein